MTSSVAKEGWASAWTKIDETGDKFWKRGEDANSHTVMLAYVSKHFPSSPKAHIFVPLCGDFPFIHLAWVEGYTISALEFVPAAVRRLRGQFEGGEEAWTESECPGGKKWVYSKGRVVIYEADFFVQNPELVGEVDVVVDKDAFGAIGIEQRAAYVEVISNYLKKGGVLVSETKEKFVDIEKGPPFHLLEDEMRKEWEGGKGEIVYEEFLGSMYEWPGEDFGSVTHRLSKKE